jgi:hypothetical protein
MTSYCWIGQVGSSARRAASVMIDRDMKRVHLILVVVALAIAGIFAFAAGGFMLRSAAKACDPNRDVFIVRQHREPGASVRAVTFFKVQPKGNERDVQLGTLEGYYAEQYYHDRKGRLLLFASDGSPQSLYVYSICEGKLQKAIDLPEADRVFTSARYVGDEDTLLVTTSDGALPADNATNSRLEVYEQGKRTSVAEVSKESPLYAAVVIIGLTRDGSVAYLREAGGDAGERWGKHYRWDKTTNSVQKLGDFVVSEEKGASGYLLGALNPSATHALHVQHARYTLEDLGDRRSNFPTCLTRSAFDSQKYDSVGDELMVRDMATQAERVIYRNLVGARNLCRNRLRTIAAPRWYNDHTIVFSMPYGIYEIDIRGGNAGTIAFQIGPTQAEGSGMDVVGANDEYLLTRRSSIVHIKTGREVSVPALQRDPEKTNVAVRTQFVIPIWTAGQAD